MIQKELGSNIQEISISQNTQNHGGTRSVKRNLKITGFQEIGFKKCQKLEEILEYHQEDQTCIF